MAFAMENDSPVSAMEVDDIETIKLGNNDVDMEEQEQDMTTSLHAAAHYDRLEIINILSSHGFNVNSILEGENLHGFTPLHLAVQKNHLECVKLLLELGASVTPQTEGIYHPIHYAVFNNFVDVARELLQHGADANVRFNNNFFEENPVTMERSLWLDHDLPLFHYSILQNHQEMLDVLSLYADKNSKTSLGKTALMQAVEVNDEKWVKNLVTKENVNDRDNFGQPVLHFTMVTANRKVSKFSKKEDALYPRRLDVVRILLRSGADINARFPENETHSAIFYYMVKYAFDEGVIYFLFLRVDFNFDDVDRFTLSIGQLRNEDITPDIKDDNHYLSLILTRLIESVYCIIRKAIDLQMIGYPVNENLILKCPPIRTITLEEYMKVINQHKNHLMQQIKWMKETKVGDTKITVWELLTCDKNKLFKFMSIESVRNFDPIEKGNAKNMINYRFILNKRLNDAKERKLFLEETTEFLFSLLRKYLPFDCCKEIVSFL